MGWPASPDRPKAVGEVGQLPDVPAKALLTLTLATETPEKPLLDSLEWERREGLKRVPASNVPLVEADPVLFLEVVHERRAWSHPDVVPLYPPPAARLPTGS
jgi:hypothetical protein